MTMITPSYLGETIEYSSLHACRSTLEDPTSVEGAEKGDSGRDSYDPVMSSGPHCSVDVLAVIAERAPDAYKQFTANMGASRSSPDLRLLASPLRGPCLCSRDSGRNLGPRAEPVLIPGRPKHGICLRKFLQCQDLHDFRGHVGDPAHDHR